MAYKRSATLPPRPSEEELLKQYAGIGFRLEADNDVLSNIENALLWASEDGMEQGDLRILALLVHWLEIHLFVVNAGRLISLVKAHRSARVRRFWRAVAEWNHRDLRLQSLRKGRVRRIDLLPAGTKFHLERHGEDPRFGGTCLRVPANVLKRRKSDILYPDELVRFKSDLSIPPHRWTHLPRGHVGRRRA